MSDRCENADESVTCKLGGAGDRFCDYLSVDCANLPCVSEYNQFTNINRPITNISKSSDV